MSFLSANKKELPEPQIPAGATEVSNWFDFEDIQNNLSGEYALTTNLDQNTEGYDAVASPTARNGNGFIGIGGTQNSSGFDGTLHGLGFGVFDWFADEQRFNDTGHGIFNGDGACLIKDFMVDGEVNAEDAYNAAIMWGATTGTSGRERFERCVVAGKLDIVSASSNHHGTFIGRGREYDQIVDSYSIAEFSTSDLSEEAYGGFIGEDNDDGDTVRCYASTPFSGSFATDNYNNSNRYGIFKGTQTDSSRSFDCFVDTDVASDGTLIGDFGNGANPTGLSNNQMTGANASSNMSALGFGGSTFATVEPGVPISSKWPHHFTVTPQSDGLPVLRSVDLTRQLSAQGISFTTDIT